MDKTFEEAIAGIRKAERGVEVREDIAQGMEYVEQYAGVATAKAQESADSAAAARQALTDTLAAKTEALQTISDARTAALNDVEASTSTATHAADTATEKAAAAAESASRAESNADAAEASAQNAGASADEAKAAQKKAQELADEVGAKVTTDASLSVSGAAADAKVTGEAIKGTRVTQAGSGRWVLLGSLANTNDSEDLVLDIYTGAGYNADPIQNLWLKVFIKDSFQNTTDTTNANCYGTRVWMFTPNVANSDYASMQFRVMATQNDTAATTSSCEVWMYVPYGYNAGDCIASGSAFSKWTSVMALSTSEPTSGTSQRVEMATVPVGDMEGSSLSANALNGFDYTSIFPVGSIYQSTNAASPAALFGGSWEQIASERVLMGASDTHAAGSTAEAGLPDIEGSAALGYTDWNLNAALKSASGAFSITKKSGAGSYPSCSVDKNSTAGTNTFSFSASDSNAIYGASDTVQPAAYYVYIWHRVA